MAISTASIAFSFSSIDPEVLVDGAAVVGGRRGVGALDLRPHRPPTRLPAVVEPAQVPLLGRVGDRDHLAVLLLEESADVVQALPPDADQGDVHLVARRHEARPAQDVAGDDRGRGHRGGRGGDEAAAAGCVLWLMVSRPQRLRARAAGGSLSGPGRRRDALSQDDLQLVSRAVVGQRDRGGIDGCAVQPGAGDAPRSGARGSRPSICSASSRSARRSSTRATPRGCTGRSANVAPRRRRPRMLSSPARYIQPADPVYQVQPPRPAWAGCA